MPPAVQWHWEDDAGVFQPFDAKSNSAVEKAYERCGADNKGTTRARYNGSTYELNFNDMSQRNTESGKVRRLRRNSPKDEKAAASAAAAPVLTDTPAQTLKKHKAEDAATAPDTDKTTTTNVVKVVQKGKGIVDPASGLAATAHVFDENGVLWQCTLNQTNIGSNNNKYYIIQLLELDSSATYHVFARWGRVGSPGQSSLNQCLNLQGAKTLFSTKFADKTQNNWALVGHNRSAFEKHPGKYHLMDIDMEAAGDDEKTAAAGTAIDHIANATAVGCSLPLEVQRLLRMIGSKGDMERAMRELEIDTKKMPLGKISKSQIKQAFDELKAIETELLQKHPKIATLMQLSSNFYTLIPHDFGMSQPPVIHDVAHLKRKMDLLELLSDLQVASTLLNEAAAQPAVKHPLVASYESLRCGIAPIDSTSPTYQRIQRYVANTHGSTHHLRVSVADVFELQRFGEADRYDAGQGKHMGNKTMLWHGSRTTNFMGILSQGLRIAPPEAPVTGYMFGKGVYFADVVTKSANYCHDSHQGLLVLCEVALGRTCSLTEAKSLSKPQDGTDSTFGHGRMVPDAKEDELDADGVRWPCGKLIQSSIQTTALLYNEYVVYDVSQIKMRYLVRCTFTQQ